MPAPPCGPPCLWPLAPCAVARLCAVARGAWRGGKSKGVLNILLGFKAPVIIKYGICGRAIAISLWYTLSGIWCCKVLYRAHRTPPRLLRLQCAAARAPPRVLRRATRHAHARVLQHHDQADQTGIALRRQASLDAHRNLQLTTLLMRAYHRMGKIADKKPLTTSRPKERTALILELSPMLPTHCLAALARPAHLSISILSYIHSATCDPPKVK